MEGVRWQHTVWREETEAADVQQLDIGLMPLIDNQWNRYKCGLKILQYMGVAVPSIASPVGVNEEIIDDGGNGMLAASAEQWEESLGRLIDDATLRDRLGQAGRQTVEQRYSIQANLPKLVEVFERVADSS